MDIEENVELNVNGGYFKNVATGKSLHLLLNAVGCCCIYKEISG